jgi:mannose-6-phosphate isomerase-like protein (cupin superfamily)
MWKTIVGALLGAVLGGLAGGSLGVRAGTNDKVASSGVGAATGECPWPPALDAVAAAPGNHKVVLENDRVRVLEVTVKPGEKEPVHAHCFPSVLYVMSGGPYKDFDGEGKLVFDSTTVDTPEVLPMAIWMEPQAPHAVLNLDKVPVRLLRVELKQRY